MAEVAQGCDAVVEADLRVLVIVSPDGTFDMV